MTKLFVNEGLTIKWSESVWFTDVDDTLIDTAGMTLEASRGIYDVFCVHYGDDKAAEVQENFNKLFGLMMAGYRVKSTEDWRAVPGGQAAFDNLVEYFTTCQSQVQSEYGHIKKWSREIFIKRSADLADLKITPEIVHNAATSYWEVLNDRVQIFPDSLRLAQRIARHQRPLFLVTSSDGRLKMQESGQFVYDPEYSEKMKRNRLERLSNRGIEFQAISIGDPEDKPHIDFFHKAVRTAEKILGYPVDMTKSIMIGDSYAGDLQTPKEQLKFGLLVLRDDQVEGLQVNDQRQVTTNNLDTIDSLISEE